MSVITTRLSPDVEWTLTSLPPLLQCHVHVHVVLSIKALLLRVRFVHRACIVTDRHTDRHTGARKVRRRAKYCYRSTVHSIMSCAHVYQRDESCLSLPLPSAARDTVLKTKHCSHNSKMLFKAEHSSKAEIRTHGMQTSFSNLCSACSGWQLGNGLEQVSTRRIRSGFIMKRCL